MKSMSKIMFAGPSGMGKTTLAEWLANDDSISFVSGSVSDLIPKTKELTHKDMLSRDPMELVYEDTQIVNFRHKKFKEYDDFVSDRSYLDSAAYFLYKQADKQPECEVEHFLELCKYLLSQECTHLIFIPYHTDLYKEWVIEDNGKRIVSSFFQMEISSIMEMILKLWGYQVINRIASVRSKWYKNPRLLDYTSEIGIIKTLYGVTKVLILREANINNRKEIIELFLNE